MNNNWAEARMQMDQVLEAERALVKVRRQHKRQRSLVQSLLRWRPQWWRLGQSHTRSTPATDDVFITVLCVTPPTYDGHLLS